MLMSKWLLGGRISLCSKAKRRVIEQLTLYKGGKVQHKLMHMKKIQRVHYPILYQSFKMVYERWVQS